MLQMHESVPSPVADLLDTTTATRRLGEAGLAIVRAEAEYLRHKPGESSIVSYRFDTPDGATDGRGYVHWCERADRADEVFAKAMTLRPRQSSVGVSTIRVDDHTVFYGFPNDARLRQLRWFSSARKLKRSLAPLIADQGQISKRLSTSTVLKYKPERRLVSKVELVDRAGERQTLLLRYATGAEAGRLASTASVLLANGVQTPAPVAQLHGGRVGVDEFIDGVELRTWLLDGESVAAELADAMLTFHSTPPPTGTPQRTVADELANAVGGLTALPGWGTVHVELAHALADRLVTTRPEDDSQPALIHGDLHDKNVMVNDRGVWFIDLERVAAGSRASDLGRLRAHAISLGIRQPAWPGDALSHADATLDRYRSTVAASAAIGDAAIDWFTAVALVDQALLVTRHLEVDRARTAPLLLEAAFAVLESDICDTATSSKQ